MTPGARRVLKELAEDEDCDLVQEGRVVYCGNRQTTSRVVNELLGFQTAFTLYGINDTGRALVRRPELEDELLKVIYSRDRKPFQIINDRVAFL